MNIIFNTISKPWLIFSEASLESIILYSLGLVLPFLLFYSRFSFPSLVGALPIYLPNIISSWGMQREFNSPYSISILPFLIMGAIDTINLQSIHRISLQKLLYSISIFISIAVFVGYARVGYFNTRYLPRLSEAIALSKIKPLIPNNLSLLTTSDLAPHFSNRRMINLLSDSDGISAGKYDVVLYPNSLETSSSSSKPNKDSLIGIDIKYNCNTYQKYYRICVLKNFRGN